MEEFIGNVSVNVEIKKIYLRNNLKMEKPRVVDVFKKRLYQIYLRHMGSLKQEFTKFGQVLK